MTWNNEENELYLPVGKEYERSRLGVGQETVLALFLTLYVWKTIAHANEAVETINYPCLDVREI